MPRQVVADPEGGLPSSIEENGARVEGILKIVACVYGAGEVPPADVKTIAELRAMWWSPAEQALVISIGRSKFTFGPKLLNQTTDATRVQIQSHFKYPTKDEPPKECSCGMLSFRHSISHHVKTAGQ